MGSIGKRVQDLETILPPPEPPTQPSTFTPDEWEYLQALEAAVNEIVLATPEPYQSAICEDLGRMMRTPASYQHVSPPEQSWLIDGTLTVLSYEVLQMARRIVDGWYAGPRRFPDVVCEELNRHSKLKYMWDPECTCPNCGFYWFTRDLWRTLSMCPLCATALPPLVLGHDRTTLLGSDKWLWISPMTIEEERKRVGIQALDRLGFNEARRWLLEDVDLPMIVVDTILTYGCNERDTA